MREKFIQWVIMAVLLWAAPCAFSQAPIPNGNMEAWTNEGLYEDPSGDWWATLNPLRALAGPVTVTKSTDAHGGSYSAKLTTASFGTLLVPGLLISGRFDAGAVPNFILSGQPYTDKPLKFSGWFKYEPVSGDSAGFAARLWKRTPSGRELVAIADTVIYDAVAGWTSFNRPFQYLMPGLTPDTLELVAVSSFGGDDFLGQVGSTLYVDDLSLTGTFVGADDPGVEQRMEAWPNPTTGRLQLSWPQGITEGKVELLDAHGRLLRAWPEMPSALELSGLPAGVYSIHCTAEAGFSRQLPILLMP